MKIPEKTSFFARSLPSLAFFGEIFGQNAFWPILTILVKIQRDLNTEFKASWRIGLKDLSPSLREGAPELGEAHERSGR